MDKDGSTIHVPMEFTTPGGHSQVAHGPQVPVARPRLASWRRPRGSSWLGVRPTGRFGVRWLRLVGEGWLVEVGWG